MVTDTNYFFGSEVIHMQINRCVQLYTNLYEPMYVIKFFAFLTIFSLVDIPCVQMITLKLKKLLLLVKHFFIQQELPNKNIDPFGHIFDKLFDFFKFLKGVIEI